MEATKCAFDKPTPQLLSFLARHFQLENPIWQPTAFVVFPAFFDGLQPEAEGKNSDADANKRPLTALERHRRSVNEHYNGSPPAQSTAGHSPVFPSFLQFFKIIFSEQPSVTLPVRSSMARASCRQEPRRNRTLLKAERRCATMGIRRFGNWLKPSG